jgi:ADP-ribose pyrophosphatase
MKKRIPNDSILIPDAAEQVFAGKIFDVFQWQQQLYDDSQATFEMLRRPDTVEVIVIDGPNILLVRDEQPNRHAIVDLPGGRVDPGETWEVAAKRELQEETGLSCANWRLITVRQPQHKVEWFVAIFIAWGISDRRAQDPGPGEKIELIWQEYVKLHQDAVQGEGIQYLESLFMKQTYTDELLALPEFMGTEVDR